MASTSSSSPASAPGPSAGAPASAPGATASSPLQGGRLAVGAIALSLATFMNVLDTSIANVSIPSIAGDLGVSPDQGTWVITSFGVANAISLPLTGWLTRRYGQVRLFTLSVALFVLTSFLCALAPSLQMLILFRVLQGAVAGPMIPLSQALLLASYPPKKAGTALAIWAMTTLVAPVVGPVLGGWITDNISWPWIFYINVPIGILAGLATWTIYRHRETPTQRLPIDAVGLGLLVLWVGAMQIMLDQGKDLDWFSSTTIVVLALIAVIGFVLFLVWELTEQHPIVDLTLFRRRNYWTSTLAISLGYGAFFGSVVLLPLWLQQYMGYTATMAGLVLAPVGLLAIALTPIVGRTVQRVDPRIYVTLSFLTFALVNFMRARFDTDISFAALLVPTVIQGAALATFFVPLVSLSLSGLPPDRVPAASGLLQFARITAGSFGTSIVTTLWDRRATLHHSQLVEHLTGGSPVTSLALQRLQSNGFGTGQSQGLINRIVDQQAFMVSADDIFYASGLLFLILIGVIWLARPARSGGGGADSSAAASGAH
ncbi:MAG TPA: DHA2 family efflux MFS transporter permease subunit [Burkholderiaceae bacterium]|jgi:DHA2 family multidrug resistance protein|nr:DHA2 family efflux MFS transporter permease subunit [Burkholderiaceae bacterium]